MSNSKCRAIEWSPGDASALQWAQALAGSQSRLHSFLASPPLRWLRLGPLSSAAVAGLIEAAAIAGARALAPGGAFGEMAGPFEALLGADRAALRSMAALLANRGETDLAVTLRHAADNPAAPPPIVWRCRERIVETGRRTLVMGVVNVTPDSFSDGGLWIEPAAAVEHALRLADEGADILDFGAESTRPGADAVPAEEEIRRLIPVIRGIRGQTGALLSVDTAKASVARAALDMGADIVNDVTAFEGDPEMADVVARSGSGAVLMHMKGTPRTMQADPRYADVVAEIAGYLSQRIEESRNRRRTNRRRSRHRLWQDRRA